MKYVFVLNIVVYCIKMANFALLKHIWQVEKQFITEIHHHLPALLQNLPMSEFIPVAPILAHYIGLFIEDSHTSKAACEW